MDHPTEATLPTESDQAVDSLNEVAKIERSINDVGSGGSGEAISPISLATILNTITCQSRQLAGLQERIVQLEKCAESRANQQSTTPATHCCCTESCSKLNAKVKLLEDRQRDSEERFDKMSSKTDDVDAQVQRVDSNQWKLEDGLSSMKMNMDELNKLRHSLNNTMHDNMTKRTEFSESLARLQDKIEAISLELAELKDIQQEAKQAETIKDEVMPSFLAKAKVGCSQVAKPNEKVVFDRVKSNVGDCYDATTSTFTAPVKGTYLFSVSVNSNSEGTLCLAIVHNGFEVANCGEIRKYAQQATTIILPLEANDCVWVKAQGQTSHGGVAIGRAFSNFTGCRLH